MTMMRMQKTLFSRRAGYQWFSTGHPATKLWIGGKAVLSLSTLPSYPVYNPATQSILTHVPESDPEELVEAVQCAKMAYPE